jgi:Permuted papain-like amidase enzyme, YaeF/YiiX, C92 family
VRTQHHARLVALALLASVSSAAPAPVRTEPGAPAAPALIEPGDVVFIAVDSALWSRLAARWSSPARRFGHVGIAARGDDGVVSIVHAGGSPVADAAPVLVESYERFAAHADRVGVYRLRAPEPARVAVGAAALQLQRAGARFDAKFSLHSTRELYCTELVWRAIKAGARLDPAPHPSVIANRAAITMLDLENSALLYETGFAARE